MATVIVDVPQELINKLADGDIAIGRFVSDAIGLKETNAKAICAQLLAFHDDVGGSPEIEKFDIAADEVIYDPETHKGKIIFKYRVRFFYGCSDINKDEAASERADFEVDLINHRLLIHILDPIRRDTSDEF